MLSENKLLKNLARHNNNFQALFKNISLIGDSLNSIWDSKKLGVWGGACFANLRITCTS